MDSVNQNKKVKEGLHSHINNRIQVRKLYQDRGITMLGKAQDLMSNMVDSQMDPNTEKTYQEMKKELSEKGYEDFKYLGKGAQGLVLLAKKGDRRYAIKGVLVKFLNGTIDQVSLQQVESEIKLLTTCKGSPYVVNHLDSFEGKQMKYLVLSECQGTLSELMEKTQDKKLNELSAIKYAKDIAEGLSFIHSKSCIVNDLKMDNILIDYNGNAVVSDFGYADSLPKMYGYGINEFVGNFYFMAPECYDPKKFDGYAIEFKNKGIATQTKPSQRSEACSLGYLLYTMISGMDFELPFKKHQPLVYDCDFSQFTYYKQLKDIIEGLTKFNPRERLSVKDAMLMLKGIISLELNLEERFTELVNEEARQALKQSYNQIEFVQCFSNHYYPIIKNEENLAQELQKAIDEEEESKNIKDLQIQINQLNETIFLLKKQKSDLEEKLQANQNQLIGDSIFQNQGQLNNQIQANLNAQTLVQQKPNVISKPEQMSQPKIVQQIQQQDQVHQMNIEIEEKQKCQCETKGKCLKEAIKCSKCGHKFCGEGLLGDIFKGFADLALLYIALGFAPLLIAAYLAAEALEAIIAIALAILYFKAAAPAIALYIYPEGLTELYYLAIILALYAPIIIAIIELEEYIWGKCCQCKDFKYQIKTCKFDCDCEFCKKKK